MTSDWSNDSDLGATSFSSKNYHEALRHYSNALEKMHIDESSSGGDSIERKKQHQILLSNVIACRLKIGGDEMISRAIGEAKECIELNPTWAKAHVRLASAYIAQGGHSNDACQALQRAISLDNNNKVAREMLIKELRRDRDNGADRSSDSAGSSETPSASAPPFSDIPANSQSNTRNNQDIDDIPPPNTSQTLSERFQHYLTRAVLWYHSQSDDKKTLFKVSFCFVLLYIALGGRFGLEYAVGQKKRGNYGANSVYELYRQPGRGYADDSSTKDAPNSYNQQTTESDDSRYNDRSNPRNEQYYSQYSNQDTYERNSRYSTGTSRQSYSGRGSQYNDRSSSRNERHYSRYNDDYYKRPRHRTNRSFGLSNLFDGSPASMAIIFAIGAVCHRFGINPLQVFMMLNMAQNRGRGGMYGRRGFGGYGGGFGGGIRFGGGRNRFGRRGRY